MPLHEDAAQFIHVGASVSDNIRSLAAAGYSRAEIARILNKRYQHVRNVLEADKLKARAPGSPAVAAPAAEGVPGGPDNIYRLELGDRGEVALPPHLQRALGLRPGGVVIAQFDEGRLVLLSSAEAWKRSQAFVRSLDIPEGVSLADELIADRRREAELEVRNG